MLEVTGVTWEWDMRSKLKLLNSTRAKRLRPGECFIAFNRSLSIARVVNGYGEMLEIRSAEGVEFDPEIAISRVFNGWTLELGAGAKILQLRPPEKKKKKQQRVGAKKAPRRRGAQAA